jgi:hypothetical protein
VAGSGLADVLADGLALSVHEVTDPVLDDAELETLRIHALEALEEAMRAPGQALNFHFEPGQIQFVNNRLLGHRRTGFRDWPEPDRKRLLVRLWLRDWGRPVRDSVDTLAALLHTGQRVHCFCHQGRSRSAVVAVAALMRAWELDVVESLGLVRAKNPRARFTPRARACLDWLQQEDPSDEPLLERT